MTNILYSVSGSFFFSQCIRMGFFSLSLSVSHDVVVCVCVCVCVCCVVFGGGALRTAGLF